MNLKGEHNVFAGERKVMSCLTIQNKVITLHSNNNIVCFNNRLCLISYLFDVK